jgi:hypothetical protein
MNDDLKNKATVDFPCSSLAQTNSIPGLYVYDNFISEGKIFANNSFRGRKSFA